MEWKGIYAPLPTPFDEEGGLDLSALRRNLDAWARSPLDGLVLCGSNGELPFLDPQERVLVTRTVRDHLGDRFPLVVGAHLPTTRGTLDLADRLADAGADALLLLPPHYFKGDPEGIRRYFTDVADRSPLPVMLYNMPANTGVNLGTDLILSLAAHPRIPAVKVPHSASRSRNISLSSWSTSRIAVLGCTRSVFGGCQRASWLPIRGTWSAAHGL